MEKYYLLDLERTIGFGVPTYWKKGANGYTRNISEAGLYSEDSANDHVSNDRGKTTISISQVTIKELLKE